MGRERLGVAGHGPEWLGCFSRTKRQGEARRGKARRGMAWQGLGFLPAQSGDAWHGLARLELARRGLAWTGEEGIGTDGRGMDGRGLVFFPHKLARRAQDRHGESRSGEAWEFSFEQRGTARLGEARRGVVGTGEAWVFSRTKWQGAAWRGSAWRGVARICRDGRGTAWPGAARRGMGVFLAQRGVARMGWVRRGEEWRGEVPFSLGGDVMAEGDAVDVLIGTLVKGDVLTAEQCVKLLGLRVEDPRYSLALLGLCKRVEDTLGELGRPCVVRCEAGGIHVMEDAEAAVYVQQRFQAHQAGLGRSHKRAQVIDQGQLSAEQRAEHERNVAMMAFKMQAIRRAGRSKLTLAGDAND